MSSTRCNADEGCDGLASTMAAANGSATQGGQEDVRTAIFKTLYPEEFLKRHLDEHVREDGRGLLDQRPASISTSVASNAQGSALVRFGTGTLVMAGVQAHISEPHHERPDEGFLVPNVDVSPICSPQFKAGPPSEGAQAITHGLQRFLNTSGVLPRKALCIEAGAAVWTLYLDVVCISADGGILDAAALAAVAALADCKLPKPSFDVDTRQCICDAAEVTRLPLAGLPTLVSFGIYESYVDNGVNRFTDCSVPICSLIRARSRSPFRLGEFISGSRTMPRRTPTCLPVSSSATPGRLAVMASRSKTSGSWNSASLRHALVQMCCGALFGKHASSEAA